MKKFTKLLLCFMLILVLAIPVSLSACSIFADDKSSGNGGKDSSGGDTPVTKNEYTVTFDYSHKIPKKPALRRASCFLSVIMKYNWRRGEDLNPRGA